MELIRIKPTELDTKVFRIFPMHRFLEMLDSKRLTLVKPKLWSDPMESIIFESAFNASGESSYSVPFKDNYFAQCWTLKYESYALWNEYAPMQNGVRVRTTLGKLIEQLKLNNTSDQPDSWFFGRVRYLSLNNINKWIGQNLAYMDRIHMSKQNKGQVHPLYIKLNQYSHENEVRIIFNSNGDVEINSRDIYNKVEIDPRDLFDRLLIDPRMPTNIYKIFKRELIENYAFNKDIIMRSGLFDEKILRKKLRNI